MRTNAAPYSPNVAYRCCLQNSLLLVGGQRGKAANSGQVRRVATWFALSGFRNMVRQFRKGPVNRSTGIICDQRVMLNGHYSAKKYPEHLRRIRFKDPESGKTLVFLTNNTTLPLEIDLEVYKWRHLIENFFCKLKEFKRIAMRSDKTDSSFAAMIYLAAGVINSR